MNEDLLFKIIGQLYVTNAILKERVDAQAAEIARLAKLVETLQGGRSGT